MPVSPQVKKGLILLVGVSGPDSHQGVGLLQSRAGSNNLGIQTVDWIFFVLFCCMCVLSHGPLFVTPWTVACQVPLYMEFSMQEYWSGLPFPSPGDLPNPGTESETPVSSALQVDSLPLCHVGSQLDLL